MSDLVSVVLVNYHGSAEIGLAIAALRRAEPELDLELIVVDNSADPVEARRLAELALSALIVNPANIGFARAANQGAALARGEFVLFLNPDVILHPQGLSTLIGAARADPDVAVLGPRLVYPDGSLQHSGRGFYRPLTLLMRRTPLGRWRPQAGILRRHLLSDRDPGATRDVDWMVGACLLVPRRSFHDLGGFDGRFFLYLEDVDLCLRAWRSGRRVRYVGAAVATHVHRRASAGWMPSRAKWLHLGSFVRFLWKYRGWPRREAAVGRQRVVFVNQGQGVLADRASRFAAALGGRVVAKDEVADGRVMRVLRSALAVILSRPRSVHVIDVGVAGVAVALAARVVGARVVLDTGDEYYELMRRTDEFRGLQLELAGTVERLALGLADVVAARGRGHVAALEARGYKDVSWLPDGVDMARAARVSGGRVEDAWRRRRGWTSRLVVASVGSLIIDRRYGTTQGSELISALPAAPGVMAAIVGDGPGRELLEAAARANGCSERVAFLGRVSPEELARLLTTFDVCMWTQSNDAVGRARTTGKLPLFLAAGCFVVAADVGEAARVLPAVMRVPYRGEYDPGYPLRVAARLRRIAADPAVLGLGADLVAIARRDFDYQALDRRVVELHVGECA